MGDGAIIDLHSHWFSPAVTALLSARGGEPRFQREGQAVSVRFNGAPFPLGPQWFDLDLRIEHLKTHGVVRQLLSWPTTLGIEPALPVEDAKTLWRTYNDDLAGLVRRRSDLFSAVAAVSTADVAWSAQELARAHDLGLVGIVLPVNALASRRSAEVLRPLFEAAQAHRSLVYLHTGYASGALPGQPARIAHGDGMPIRGALETMHHFAQAVTTLAFTDFLDPFPDVSVQVAMLGGSGLTALLAEQAELNPQRLGGGDWRRRFRQIWLDTGAAGQGPAAVAAAVSVLGADRIVFGSDYAPAPDIKAVADNVRRAGLSPDDERRIFFDNGAALLRRHGVTLQPAHAAQ